MKKVVAIGIQDFEVLRTKNLFYVDKTDFIREWWKGEDAVTLITRPRRFGKTLNMSTLNCFFSNQYQNRGDLFEGLRIWEDCEMRKQQGKWPVIFLSFADIKASTFEDTKTSLNQMITKLYNQYDWMMKDERFSDRERELFSAVGVHMDAAVAARSLQNLCEWMKKYYGKRVLIFLDEYDTPLQEAYIHGYWDELVSYTRALFNSTFKTNPSLERGMMTGITRVSKESIFSDLNNLTVVTTTSSRYTAAFGFTEDEVYTALEEQGYGDASKAEVKTWYDGFTFGTTTDIYNPWSVINYLKDGKLDIYWANTSSNGLVGTLLRSADPEIKQYFEALMHGETIEVSFDEQIVFNQLDVDRNAIWSLLLASGYLKVMDARELREPSLLWSRPLYPLALTNLEVRIMFTELIRGWFRDGAPLNTFVKYMIDGETEGMENYLNDLMRRSMSSFDGKQEAERERPECFYHGLVLGLIADQEDRYLLKSNRESGYGRYDVMLEPIGKGIPGIILEFKVYSSRKGEKTLEDTAQSALDQIEKKRYGTELLDRGIPETQIRKYGIAFRGKECRVLMA